MIGLIRKYLVIFYLIAHYSAAQIPEFTTSFEENNFSFNGNRIHETYAVEIPGYDEAMTYTLQELGVKDDQLNVVFFSEVNGTFSFFVNGDFVMSREVNTVVDASGNLPPLTLYPIQFSSGQDSATLRVSSLKYGEFQTQIKRSYPMLYLKRYKNEWYLDHNTIVKMPFQFFLTDHD